MTSMKNYETMSYRQLQAVAKNTKVPANLKKSYLVKLLIARSKGDESLVLKIVQEAHCERAHNKGRQSIRSIVSLQEESSSERNIRRPNTELEKLLKAPLYTRLENSEVNRNTRNTRYNGRNSRCCDTNQVAKVSTTTHQIGRNRKMLPSTKPARKFEIKNLDSDTDTQYDSDVSNNLKSGGTVSQLKNKFDPLMHMIDPINQTPQSSTSSEYLDVDNWTSYDGSTNSESGLMNTSKNISEYIETKSDIMRESTNVIKLDEFNGCFGREQVYSHCKKQKLTSSEIPSFNMHDFYQKPYEPLYKKENYIVINQHFQFYGSMLPEQNRNVIQEIHNYDTVSNNRLPSFDIFENPCDNYNTIDNKYALMNNSGNVHHTDSQTSGKREDHCNKALTLPNSYDSKNFTMCSKNVIENSTKIVRNNGSNLVYKNTKNQYGLYGNDVLRNKNTIGTKHTADTISLSPEINKSIEYYNNAGVQIPDESNYNQDVQKKSGINPNDFLNEFLSLELRYDINDDISSAIQDYFENLDFPTNAENLRILTSEDVPMSSEEEVYTSHMNDMNSPTKNQWDLPYVPINGVPTSMLCFICDWIGRISEFDSHVRMKHSNDIFVTDDGMLTIAINMGLMSKKMKNHQKQCFIVHEGNLFIAHFKYKYPDIIQPILLSIPPAGLTVIENTLLASTKFYMQIINYMKEQEMLWTGMIECVNKPGRPLDIDVFSHRKHGKFEVSMRSLDLVPNNIPLKEISEYLDGCIVEIHFFIETQTDL